MEVTSKRRITVDIRKNNKVAIPSFVQGDTNVVEFEILDNGVAADLSTVGKVVANYKRPDKHVVTREPTYAGNIVSYRMGQEEMEVAGVGEVEVQFFNADYSKRVSTFAVRINVAQSVGEAAELSDELGNTLLQDLLVKADYAEEQAKQAEAAAKSAVTNWLSPVANKAAVDAIAGPKLGDTVQTNDNGFVYRYDGTKWVKTQEYGATALANVSAQLADVSTKRNIGFITLKQLGIVDDGVQVDFTFSGTGTTLDGKTRKRWISQSGKETYNSNLLKQAIADGWNIVVEKGNYVFNPKVKINLRNNLTIQGFGDDCRIIGCNLQGWNSHLSFEKFMIEGAIDLKPPAQLEVGTETWFNNTNMFDIYNDLKFYSYDADINRSPIGIWIQPQDILNDVKTVDNVRVIDVKFKNLQSGALFGDRDSSDRGFRINNIYVNNCRTDQIWWHGFGTNNGKNHTVENCKSINHYCGMVADFSRGTVNATINNCIAENCVNLSKSETNSTMLSDNHKIINNIFRYIDDGQPKYHYRDLFVIKVTGKAFIKNNEIEFWGTHEFGVWLTSYWTSSKHVEVMGNRFVFTNSLHPNRTYIRPKLFAISIMQMNNIANSTSIIKDNSMVIDTNTATGFVYARNKIEYLIVSGNKVSQLKTSDFVFYFSDTNVDGEVKDVSLDGNKVDSCSYFLYSSRENSGKISITGNEIDKSLNTFCLIKPGTETTVSQSVDISYNKIKAMTKLIDILRVSNFRSVIIRGNQFATISGISSGFYFMLISNSNIVIDSFIYENNSFIDPPGTSFTMSARFNFLQVNSTTYSVKEFIFANNQCIMHEYFIAFIGSGTGGNKLRVSNNMVEAKGSMDGRSVQFLYHTGNPFSKGVISNNEIINNYSNNVIVNYYSTYKGANKNILDSNVSEIN